MKDLLVLLPRHGEDALAWCVRDGAHGVRWGLMSEETPPAGDWRVIAIAPGADITTHHVELPGGSEAQARAAAPFAVEDEIALDLEQVHVVLGPRGEPEATRPVAVVTKERMSAWLEALHEAGLRPARLTADYLALPVTDGAVVVDAGDRVLVRTQRGGFAVDPDLASLLVPQTLGEEEIESIDVWADDPRMLGLDSGSSAVRRHPRLDEAALLDQFLRGVDEGPPIDLLQGEFRVRRGGGQSAAALAPWRAVGALAAVVGVAWLAGAGLEAWSFRSAAQELRTRAQTTYAAAFPDDARASDPRRRIQARLAEAGAGAGGVGFLELSAVAFEAVAPLERVQIESLRFDAEEGALFVSMIYDTYGDVEAFMASAAARGVAVEEGGSRRNGRRMSGDMVLRAS